MSFSRTFFAPTPAPRWPNFTSVGFATVLAPFRNILAPLRKYHNHMRRHPQDVSSQLAYGNKALVPQRLDSTFLLLDSEGVCIVAEPITYAQILDLASRSCLEIRLGLLEGVEVAMLGERGRPRFVFKLRALEAHVQTPPRFTPLRVGTFVGGALARHDLGLLEPLDGGASPPAPVGQPGLGLAAPEEEAWWGARKHYRIVGAPF